MTARKVYKFMLYYLRYLEIAKANGCVIADEFSKPFAFYEEIVSRSQMPKTAEFANDGLYKACLKLYNALWARTNQEEELHRMFLAHWGVQAEPWEVFHSSKNFRPAQKYVRVFLIDENQGIERARNGGNGTIYYGDDTDLQTKEEFRKEAEKAWNNLAKVGDVSEVYVNPPMIQYWYHGKVYIKFVTEEEKGE